MHKYDIYDADLNPPRGHVQAWYTPVLVVQNNIINQVAGTTIIIPFTTNISSSYPGDVIVTPSAYNGLKTSSKLIGTQIMVIDKKRLKQKKWTLEQEYHDLLRQAIDIVLDRDDTFV